MVAQLGVGFVGGETKLYALVLVCCLVDGVC